MSSLNLEKLSDVSETMLLTLYLRATESQRPDALLKDDKAVELVRRIRDENLYDLDRIESIPLTTANKLVITLRCREFDRRTREFLEHHPDSVVVHIGCGLDTRYERIAAHNDFMDWYDLDLPEVIELRRKLIGDEKKNYHLLGCSVFDNTWLETVNRQTQRPCLFLAEGVFMYFKKEQVKSLVLKLHDHFPGSELIFDAYAPIHVLRHNLQTYFSKINLHIQWGIWRGKEIESWSDDIRMLGEWGYLDCSEPRIPAAIRWLSFVERLARTIRIYHFKLGKSAE